MSTWYSGTIGVMLLRDSLLPFTTMSITYQLSRLTHTPRLWSSGPLHPFHPFPQPSTVFTRRAMMSALRSPTPHEQPQQQRHHAPASPQPPQDATPAVLPEGTQLSNDAASPQVAARPPPAPKAEKPRPKIRSTKAALTIVSALDPSRSLNSYHNCLLSPVVTYRRVPFTRTLERSNPTAHTHWRAEQGVCRTIISPRLRRQARKV